MMSVNGGLKSSNYGGIKLSRSKISLLLEPITSRTQQEKLLGISPCRFRSFSL